MGQGMDNDYLNFSRFIRPLSILIVLVAIATVLSLAAAIFGYGTIHINTPAGTTVKINNKAAPSKASINVRPGDYQAVISSPTTDPYQTTLHVGLFSTTTLSPKLTQRNPNAIVDATVGAGPFSGAPQLIYSKWLVGNTWLVGAFMPGPTIVALHLDTSNNQWTVGFYTGSTSYPHDISSLPTDVTAAIHDLEARYANQ